MEKTDTKRPKSEDLDIDDDIGLTDEELKDITSGLDFTEIDNIKEDDLSDDEIDVLDMDEFAGEKKDAATTKDDLGSEAKPEQMVAVAEPEDTESSDNVFEDEDQATALAEEPGLDGLEEIDGVKDDGGLGSGLEEVEGEAEPMNLEHDSSEPTSHNLLDGEPDISLEQGGNPSKVEDFFSEDYDTTTETETEEKATKKKTFSEDHVAKLSNSEMDNLLNKVGSSPKKKIVKKSSKVKATGKSLQSSKQNHRQKPQSTQAITQPVSEMLLFLDNLLGSLEKHKIEEFIKSKHYTTYLKLLSSLKKK